VPSGVPVPSRATAITPEVIAPASWVCELAALPATEVSTAPIRASTVAAAPEGLAPSSVTMASIPSPRPLMWSASMIWPVALSGVVGG
jgi:hypothetical protein